MHDFFITGLIERYNTKFLTQPKRMIYLTRRDGGDGAKRQMKQSKSFLADLEKLGFEMIDA